MKILAYSIVMEYYGCIRIYQYVYIGVCLVVVSSYPERKASQALASTKILNN